jgi:hypothetical protein
MLPTQFQDQVARRYVGDGRHRLHNVYHYKYAISDGSGWLLETWTKDSRA